MPTRTKDEQKPRRGKSQEEIDDILGAALDDLDDPDDVDGVGQHQEPPQPPKGGRVMFGPEPPPPSPPPPGPAGTSSRENGDAPTAAASLEDAMSQLLRAGEALESSAGGGGGLDLDGAEKMLDALMAQMQMGGDLGGLDGNTGSGGGSTGSATAAEGGSRTKTEGGLSGNESRSTKSKESGAPRTAKTNGSKGGDESDSPKPSAPPTATGGVGESDVDRAVARLLSDMAKAGTDDETGGMEASQMEGMGEEMMENMMKELSAFGSSGDADDVVDGMMRQLLSKDLMYDPMKQVCDRFPAWLAESKERLTEEEYERYGKQYQYFQRIVHVYENDPENFPRLMELMQDIQEYGQPPAEIIQELAPGLEFDAEGMPKMDGQGMPPGMPPFAPGGEQCSIM